MLYLKFETLSAQILWLNIQNNFYRLNVKAVERLDGRMLLRLQDLRKEVNYVVVVFFNITELAAL